MKRLLMICYYYPPIIEVGSLRSIAFSKYLPRYGWIPTVLTVSNPYKIYCRVGNVPPPEGTRVIKAPSFFNVLIPVHLINALYARVRRFLRLPVSYKLYLKLIDICFPDFFAPWIPGAVLRGLSLRHNNFDAIYASCSPFSSAIIGVALKKWFDKPLILDFRDPMTKHTQQMDENLFNLGRQKIEERVLKLCDHLIVVTKGMMESYLEAYPFLKGKISVINNGFEDSFLMKDNHESIDNSRFVINYTGNFYHEIIPPEPFFKVMRGILDNGSIHQKKILFQYVGQPGDWFYNLVKKYSLHEVVEVTGYVPLERVKQYLHQATVMLLRNPSTTISRKLLEGLALGKEFLAILPPRNNEAEELLRKYSPNSIVVGPSDERGIASGIKELYNLWQARGILNQIPEEFLVTYNWQELTRKLAQVLDQTQ
jgi:glycosyltransferase involved in cell wall biosynthesis